ncbi:MAG: glycosyltransferase [Pseudarcicella sp.]|nr:glycosyltransferase [Pseudarcicella sp.]
MPLISIITINFNNKTGLEKTFLSVFHQTVCDFEYIVIDGNSTDGSKETIAENATKINYWVSEKDSGIYNAMNKGITAAKGKYLLFLNSGDALADNNVLEKVMLNIQDEAYSFYFGNLYLSKNNVRTQIWVPHHELSFCVFVSSTLPHPACFIRKDLFDKYGFYNTKNKIVSDWEFFFMTICRYNESYKKIEIVVSDFDLSGISSNKNHSAIINMERNEALQKHFPLLKNEIYFLEKIQNKRLQQIAIIQKNKLAWKILKAFIKFLLLFMKEKPQQVIGKISKL